MTVAGIGCDLQAHQPVRAAWSRHGDRYLRTVFSPLERRSASADVPLMALRFAVKESVAKALQVRSDQPLPWREISVLGARSAEPAGPEPAAQVWQVHLTGAARSYARTAGITHWLVEADPGDTCDTAIATVLALAGAKSSIRAMMETRRGDCTAVESHRTTDLGGGRTAVADMPGGVPERTTADAPRLGETHMSQEQTDAVNDAVETVRQVVAQHAHLSTDAATLAETDSLYGAGMTSHASVNVMLGVEDAFDIEFPEEMLTKETFESLNSIAAAVAQLQDEQ
ncbi:acyl carrier protein [Kocuria sp. JC486]|uniref:acyl carrier protein n=1 Tax=Kocuria sp. JC486 TaxID=1970736 RepID=UPI001422A44E|nr:acyl carrier protein [Kocuria sp. JC486]NHU85373.1 acyl carrier protein [Kocuria sp. JC486]